MRHYQQEARIEQSFIQVSLLLLGPFHLSRCILSLLRSGGFQLTKRHCQEEADILRQPFPLLQALQALSAPQLSSHPDRLGGPEVVEVFHRSVHHLHPTLLE